MIFLFYLCQIYIPFRSICILAIHICNSIQLQMRDTPQQEVTIIGFCCDKYHLLAILRDVI